MKNINFDFAKGEKTVTGILLMLIPVIASLFGVVIVPATVTAIVAQVFTVIGSALALYGGTMKAIRMIKALILTFKK